jgi:methyl-accepting chemotaxis protein
MLSFTSSSAKLLEKENADLRKIKTRADLLDETCGIGLWEALLHDGDAMHIASKWTWSAEMRRLIGFDSKNDFPDVVQSWSDRLHPDDIQNVFAAFGGHLKDKTGRTRYDVSYRLKIRDGSYRWFRATGGCRHDPDGKTILACGSLTDIHEQTMLQKTAEKEAADDRRMVEILAVALARIATGDLTLRITENFPAKAQQLKDDFNTATANLQAIIGGMAGAVDTMVAETQEINKAAGNLAQRTQQQAATLEETAAAVEEITVTVQKSADGAHQAAVIATETRKSAEYSGTIVDDAVKAMAEIKQSSQQIEQIIGVIDEIAFQTNLLALNAGVEAARAGEAGRGFAVVAQEVRELAQRSAKAAKEIKALISTSSNQVEKGVSLVGQTGEALNGIVEKVTGIANYVSGFAASSREQSAGVSEINRSVNAMDHMTQQNAAMVEETNAATSSLARNMQTLHGLLSQLKIAEQRHENYGSRARAA